MPRHVARVAGPRDGKVSEVRLSPARTVLVVVRDSATGGDIVGAVQRRGFPAMQGTTVPQALYWARRQPPALVIVDARVPGWPHLVREFRQKGRAVVALVEGSDSRTKALEAGCLDVQLSGLEAEELAHRVETLVGHGWASGAVQVESGPLVVDLSTDTLIWCGRRIAASQLLLRLAAYLAAHAGRVVPTKVLLEEVWGEPWANPNKVHQAIWRLRRLLGEPADSVLLVGRQRHGYALVPQSSPLDARESVAGF
jgi:DNA-binding response OmpR family regulator